ncbi:MAG: hypothetical protein OEY14_04075 [Myxococcales bacterium]|nr:hypothetical protein [Myxococcales bacterium]
MSEEHREGGSADPGVERSEGVTDGRRVDPDRGAILRRRARLVAIAMGGLGLGAAQGCAESHVPTDAFVEPEACLSAPLPDACLSWIDSGPDAPIDAGPDAAIDAGPMPCLEPPLDAGPDSEPMPCLSPPLDGG